MAEKLEDRTCAFAACGVRFTPRRADQHFHQAECRKAYWRDAYHWSAHPCPLCTTVHDPEEAPILDALEMLLRGRPQPMALMAPEVITAFIQRRRAVLRGDTQPVR